MDTRKLGKNGPAVSALGLGCMGMTGTYGEPNESEPWLGRRPNMPDSLPVIGPTRRHPNAFLAFGHGHVGLIGAPMTGRAITDLIAGRPPAIDLAPFGAARFS